MNRTQHLTTSQPRPKRRVERPGACSLQVVAKPTMAANDHHMARADELPGPLATRKITVPLGKTRDADEQLTQAVGAEPVFLDRCAAVIAVDQMQRRIITDNGKEFHSPVMDDPSASLGSKSAEAADFSMRGAV